MRGYKEKHNECRWYIWEVAPPPSNFQGRSFQSLYWLVIQGFLNSFDDTWIFLYSINFTGQNGRSKWRREWRWRNARDCGRHIGAQERHPTLPSPLLHFYPQRVLVTYITKIENLTIWWRNFVIQFASFEAQPANLVSLVKTVKTNLQYISFVQKYCYSSINRSRNRLSIEKSPKC